MNMQPPDNPEPSFDEVLDSLEKELAATKQKLLAEQDKITYLEAYIEGQKESFDEIAQGNIALQLHIKELWGALDIADGYMPTYGRDSICNDHIYVVKKALAKQPDTRALDKALLESRIDELTFAYGQTKSGFIDERIGRYEDKLAELNKE